MDCLLDHSSNESIGLVGGVPFYEYCRGISPIKYINTKILRRYLGKPVKVWFIRDKKDSRTYRGEDVTINCILEVEFSK